LCFFSGTGKKSLFIEQYNYGNIGLEIIFFNSNLQHNISHLKPPIASVPAFKGISINTGLGITISTKNQDE